VRPCRDGNGRRMYERADHINDPGRPVRTAVVDCDGVCGADTLVGVEGSHFAKEP
jgi:hypothetical protein